MPMDQFGQDACIASTNKTINLKRSVRFDKAAKHEKQRQISKVSFSSLPGMVQISLWLQAHNCSLLTFLQ